MFLLLSLFSQIALCADEKTYYIGTEPNGNGTGTVDDPLPNDIEKIKEALRNSDKSVVNLYFTEGFHYFNNTGIMGWDYNQEIVHHVNFCGAGSGKSVLHGGKKLTGWKKSTKYQKLWELDYHDSVHSFYVNDRRARLGRAPNFWDYAQIKSYEVEDDPSNSSLVIKRFGVQKDCIRFLQKKFIGFKWFNYILGILI
ncbi:hypothetical protein TRFO_04405 [Tritrichomonas foetus]|uniref:Uncharacterized protein n=1 Tax=Tritrichomonas foetus TaxID=1144522 RepID=A0A1J4KEK2_9EUKA|nr:hypothetical protein TRFO_04405 [Tritrichomonas foetus]|eukprot:OHT09871.1 hypothetical protein TRFO_04405 [Tritrichomonas foetus]